MDVERATRTALARRAISMIDLTDLDDQHAPDGIDALCERAVAHGTAAVCVWPEFVERCAEAGAGSDLRVATVVNFPGGEDPIDEVVALVERSRSAGADEIDVVIPWRSVLQGDTTRAVDLLAAVRGATGEGTLKVILESGAVADAATVRELADLAIDGGADFLKTSTGKTARGASLEAVATMLGAVADAGRTVGLKPSGGIRTFDDAERYLALVDGAMGPDWATPATFRFGASGLLDALLAELVPPSTAST
jgi:deoxyribose-phosphate aldolase